MERSTGVLRTDRGISLFDDVAKAVRFGIAYQVEFLPEGLKVQQRGRDASHYELMPAEAMTFERYVALRREVVLRPVPGSLTHEGV